MAKHKASLLSEQIYEKIHQDIQNGKYPKGQLIPSERVLIGQYGISRPTVRKALSRLEKEGLLECRPGIGYAVVRKAKARSKSSHSKLIGLILNFASDQHSGGIQIIERKFSEKGYSILLGVSDLEVSKENDCIDRFQSIDVAGFVIYPSIHGQERPHMADLIQRQIPVVAVGEPRAWCLGNTFSNKVNVVGMDNTAAVQLMMSHLYELGHRRIGLVGELSMKNVKTIRERMYYQFLEEHNIQPQPDRVIAVDPSDIHSGRDVFKSVFEKKQSAPTALICQSTPIALHVSHLLQSQGLRVPNDVSVGTFSFQEKQQNMYTHVSYSAEEYASEIVNLLVAQIQGNKVHKKVLILPELFAQESTAALRSSTIASRAS